MAKQTRLFVGCPIFGAPALLPKSQLPTIGDILRFYQYTRYKLKLTAKEPSSKDIISIIATELQTKWVTDGNLPTVSIQRIRKRIEDEHLNYRSKMKQFNKVEDGGNIEKLLVDISDYRDSNEYSLFDICSCKCPNLPVCSGGHERIDPKEVSFLIDQRSDRLMAIGSVDVATTKVLKQRMIRKEQAQARIDKYQESLRTPVATNSDQIDCDSEGTDDSDSDPEWQPKQLVRSERLNLWLYAIVCDRTAISDTAAARLANALFVCLGIVDQHNRSSIVDKSKIRREREKVRRVLVKRSFDDNSKLSTLYFDGRRDSTKVRTDGKYKDVTEDHYSLVNAEGQFIGHITVPEKSTTNQAKVGSLHFMLFFTLIFL